MKLLWVVANNEKTGVIPTAYVGATPEEARASCAGCPLLARRCYAWHGTPAMAFVGQHVPRHKADPTRFALATVLARAPKALAARVGALGDPARATRKVLLAALATLRAARLAVVGYTHFWRHRRNSALRTELMASCDSPAEADEAISMGWCAAVVLPLDHQGRFFVTPEGARGFVCPAQLKANVTCNTCRMCDPQHAVWSAGAVQAVGFVDHSPAARAARRRVAAGQRSLYV